MYSLDEPFDAAFYWVAKKADFRSISPALPFCEPRKQVERSQEDAELKSLDAWQMKNIHK